MDSWSVLAKVVPAQRQIQTSNHPRNYFCSALDIASLGGRPCLHCLTLQFVESNILYLPTRVVQHPRRLRLDFPLDKICPVTNPKKKNLSDWRKLKYAIYKENTTDMRSSLSQQGCLILGQKDVALQCFGFERPWGALCVQYRDLHGRGDLHGCQKYVRTWQKSMWQCVQQRLLEVLALFWQVLFCFISTDCPGRVCESVLEWSMSPYKLI